MDVWQFIKKYYVDSIVYKQGYNVVNTLTWAVLLVVAVILIYKFLSRRIEFDEKFAFANVPFIVFGSSIRVVEDAGFLTPPTSYFFMTPLIYVVVFSIAFLSLIVSLRIDRKNYWKIHVSVGTLISTLAISILLVNLKAVNWWVMPLTLLLATVFTCLFYLITKISVFNVMRNPLSYAVFFSHMLDGNATFIGIQYLNYWELHVLPRFLITTFGAWIMVPTKFIVFFIVLYILDSTEDTSLKDFLKFVLITLGLAPGIRDALRMTFSV